MCGGARVAGSVSGRLTQDSPQSREANHELLGPEMTILFTKSKMSSDTQDLLCAHFLAHLHVLLRRKLKAERSGSKQRGGEFSGFRDALSSHLL